MVPARPASLAFGSRKGGIARPVSGGWGALHANVTWARLLLSSPKRSPATRWPEHECDRGPDNSRTLSTGRFGASGASAAGASVRGNAGAALMTIGRAKRERQIPCFRRRRRDRFTPQGVTAVGLPLRVERGSPIETVPRAGCRGSSGRRWPAHDRGQHERVVEDLRLGRIGGRSRLGSSSCWGSLSRRR